AGPAESRSPEQGCRGVSRLRPQPHRWLRGCLTGRGRGRIIRRGSSQPCGVSDGRHFFSRLGLDSFHSTATSAVWPARTSTSLRSSNPVSGCFSQSLYLPGGTSLIVNAPLSSVTATQGCGATYTHAVIDGCRAQPTRSGAFSAANALTSGSFLVT